MNWKIGQKLVCVSNRFASYCIVNGICLNPPKKGDTVFFDGYWDVDSRYIHLVGFDMNGLIFTGSRIAFLSQLFRPLETRRDAKKDLLNQFIEVVESPDCPIQTPQTV